MTGKTHQLVALKKDKRNEEELNSIFYLTGLPPKQNAF